MEFTPEKGKYQEKDSRNVFFFQKKSFFMYFQIAERILYAIFYNEIMFKFFMFIAGRREV